MDYSLLELFQRSVEEAQVEAAMRLLPLFMQCWLQESIMLDAMSTYEQLENSLVMTERKQ